MNERDKLGGHLGQILATLVIVGLLAACAGSSTDNQLANTPGGALATTALQEEPGDLKDRVEGEAPELAPKATSPSDRELTPDTGTANLYPDGSGDYPSLEAAVRDVAAGTTLVLAAGSYRLATPVSIDKDLTITGAGMDATEIISAEPGYVLRFAPASEATLTLQDLTVQHEGRQEADAMRVERGVIEISRSRFAGAVAVPGGAAHAGLHLSGTASGTVQDSEVVGNSFDGIFVDEKATLEVSGTLIHNNAEMGLHFGGGSTGLASGNTVRDNGLSGIAVSGSSAPRLYDNTLTGNVESGLAYFDNGGGEALDNEASRNGLHGIVVTHAAAPLLDSNTCANNAVHGIAYFERASGTARANTCTGNGLQGFALLDEAAPALEENVASANDEAGFFFAGLSTATAHRNEATGNTLSGFIVADEAAPLLVGNGMANNGENGIGYFDQGGGQARQNTIEDNSLHGIGVTHNAAPTLEANTLRNNANAGIAYFEQGGGMARDNTISGSTWGIYIEATAGVQLGENQLNGNEVDLDDRR
jgi:parallel beta-helix repeat protein